MTPCLEGTGKGNVINAPFHMAALRSRVGLPAWASVCPNGEAGL
jgi:hypothetical protein